MQCNIHDRQTVEQAYPASAHQEYVDWLASPEHGEHAVDLDAYPNVRLDACKEDGTLSVSHGYFVHIFGLGENPPVLVKIDQTKSHQDVVNEIINLTSRFLEEL